MIKNSTEKGDTFEKQVFGIIKELLDNDNFYVSGKKSKIFAKKPYYSKEREGNIVTDISIETYLNGADKYSLLTIIECKNLSRPIPTDDIEEFDSKLRQIGEHNLKGILISKSGFHSGTFNFACSKGIGLINIKDNKEIEWINYRKNNALVKTDIDSIETKLCNAHLLENNFFAYYNSKTYEHLPFLLIDLEIINYFENSSKYINIPYINDKQIRHRINSLFPQDIYNNDFLNLDITCDYLCNKLGVIFEFNESIASEVLGKICFNPLQIHINSQLKNDNYRWRFTLAHEIGHLVLHKEHLEEFIHENIDIADYITLNHADTIRFNKRLEIQANNFASELLIPFSPLLRHVTNYFVEKRIYKKYLYLDNQSCNQNLVFGLLHKLQSIFGVSKEVAKIRLKNLNLLKDTTDTSINNIMRNII